MGAVFWRISTLLGTAFLLAGCALVPNAETDRALQPLNVIDDANLNDIMLTAASPDEAVAYFQRAVTDAPDRPDLQRGLARSLVRAQRAEEAIPIWQSLVRRADAPHEDRVGLAEALVRTGDWDAAEDALDRIPPTVETYDRYRLEAMVADSNQDWERADSFYQTAAGLTTQPANILNNWGYSRLMRGDHGGAEDILLDAIRYDPMLFTAKNNLVLARAAQGNYQLPLVQMTQVERAQLLHTAALAAIRRGDVEIGRGLLQNALDTHPQHFEAAAQALRTLEGRATPL